MKNMGMTCRQEVLYRNVRISHRIAQIQEEFKRRRIVTHFNQHMYSLIAKSLVRNSRCVL